MGFAAAHFALLLLLTAEVQLGNPRDTGDASAAQRRSPAAELKPASDALAAGEPERAMKLLAPFVKQKPRSVQARLLLARAYLAREEYGPAHEQLRRALALDARNVDVLYYLGMVTGELAAREFNRLHELAPDSARAHLLMAESLVAQHKLAEASAEYELALTVAPKLVEALIGLAELRREQADCSGAIVLYERAEGVARTYDAAYGLGMCLALRNEHPRAIEQFRRAIEQTPTSAAAHFALGSSLLQTGDAASAAAALQRSISLQPRLRQAYYLLGRTYRMLGKDELSRQAFARADELMRDERAQDVKGLGIIRRHERP